ncbi:fumarate/nitrate reduction transcriptional regulator Fnr [Parachitinimonas caeni]|uniref:Fumarate/nitrate reduction transcriptional regulator Fnr n=1 Tax=Parachitinimonas caeni TaxID=3031301 RepID=A0ABT7DTE3_9NEIS|nr:fumarate/nitrate reduction transcriptional regulator Fnr [Parachitinimonas caeni]MDK2123346.1 fumarate/nitrate reduction transcriptional regulator Fnr [Parachitinimonas caeni]
MQPNVTVPITDVSLHHFKAACSACSLRELCLPLGLSQDEMNKLDTIINQRIPVKRGEYLFRAGDPFRSLYAIRTGFFKTCVVSEDGREQVTGFQMSGELIGLDAISTETHACDAIALEDCEVCELPFSKIESLSRDIPALQLHFYKVMSREIVRDQGVMLLLGNMRAEERLAAFLINLSQRLAARGFSAVGFHLRMTREEIGSYLGLKLETVSRTLSKFQADGLITVQNKQIELVDLPAIKRLLTGCQGAHS